MRAIALDCEIRLAVPPKNAAERVPGIRYCDSWNDKANMGLACVGVYEWTTGRYRVFSTDSIDSLRELVRSADLIVTYNGDGFDLPLLEATVRIVIEPHRSYDLLTAIYDAAGGRFKGSGLGAVATANGLAGKGGDGAMAPVLWQRGLHAELHDYCLSDVHALVKLTDKVLTTGELTDPRGGFLPLSVRRPW